MAKRLNVVISQSQSKNPAKRDLEENIIASLIAETGIDVSIVPHLYDLMGDSTGMLCLQGIPGDMIVLSWLFPRAAHWTLDRSGITGKYGVTLMATGDEEEEEDATNSDVPDVDETDRVIDQRQDPNRTIFCLDLRASESPQEYVDEVKRIFKDVSTQVVQLMDLAGPQNETSSEAVLSPIMPVAGKGATNGNGVSKPTLPTPDPETPNLIRIEEQAPRRWYPVIDFARCTNCMECVDFCLFGVYGVDERETILVEQPDNCRKGCPACSRVCPENAIMFPQHKTPTIAGSEEVVAGGLKVDLSQLFGAPTGESAIETASQERDEQLRMAGRKEIGLPVSVPKRQENVAEQPKDELDDLMDRLDDLDL